MGVFGLLFGFQGRIKRSQWWLGQLALLGAVVVVFIFWGGALAGWMASKGLTGEKLKEASTGEQLQVATSFIVMFAVIALVVMWMGFALAIKRLHDRGKSGWWVLAYGVPGSLAVLMSSQVLSLVALCAKVWYLIELGFLKGNTGDNQFGEGDSADISHLVAADMQELHRADYARKSAAAGPAADAKIVARP